MPQELIQTKKGLSERDASQTLQSAHNDVNSTIAVDGFLVGKVGRKMTLTLSTTSIANDTEFYAFSENGVDLYTLKMIYTDGNRTQLLTAERTA